MGKGEEEAPASGGGGWNPGVGMFVGGIAVGMVLLGVLWLVVATVTGGSEGDRSRNAADLGVASGSTTKTKASFLRTPLGRCALASAVAEHPLDLATPAMDQWDVHVGAMNKLVVGSISLQQATAFWNSTRVGAYHHIDDFEAAQAKLERQGVDCPSPRRLGSDASPALRACAERVDAELQAVHLAHTAITTWSNHVRDMDRLRAGKLSPAVATQMWLQMWQRGVRELEQFRAAAHAAHHTGTCADTGAASSTDKPAPAPSTSESPTDDSMPGMDME